ncbi:hypothetical protein [Arthrospira sp. PCC 8006]|uniref:hypothetical protein n=1 Tax=Arthrospira sp. PCC 8006 TaxID=1982224 RepID=UPI00396F391A
MSIGYYGKRDDDKFAFCSAVKSGESGTFLVISQASELIYLTYGYSGKVYQVILLTSMIGIGVIPKVMKNY